MGEGCDHSVDGKNKIAFINGTITKPDMKKGASPTEMSAWVIVNSMITSWVECH